MGEMIHEFVNAVVLTLVGVFGNRAVERRKKKILRHELLNKGFQWRNFDKLCRVIREDEESTKRLLLELGARASSKEKNMWTLEHR